MRALVFATALSACTPWTHVNSRELRSASIVAGVGGGLLIAAPSLNGDPLAAPTTIGGSVMLAAAIAGIVASYALDPGGAR